jgi:hypothetical protein
LFIESLKLIEGMFVNNLGRDNTAYYLVNLSNPILTFPSTIFVDTPDIRVTEA